MILITGASGFIGKHLVNRLSDEKIKFCCFVKRRTEYLKEFKVKMIEGDIRDKEAVKRIFREQPNIEEVIHLAAIIKSTSIGDFQSVNVNGTKNLVEECEKNKVRKIIFLSTDMVLYPRKNNPYAESKTECEKIIKSSSLKYTILRPTPIYGKWDDKNFVPLIRLIKKYPLVPVLDCLMEPVCIDDVISAILKSIKSRNTINKEYNLPGGSTMSFKEMVETICRILELKRLTIKVPNFLTKNLVKIYEAVSNDPVLRYYQIEKWISNKKLNTEKEKKDLNYRPIKFEEGMKSYLKDSN